MHYDDYFDEPSEFERQIEEFKNSLLNAVKQEHQEEIQRLRAENAELQGVKRRMKEIELERINEKRDHEHTLKRLEYEV